MKKRLLAGFLTITMLMSLLPIPALAVEGQRPEWTVTAFDPLDEGAALQTVTQGGGEPVLPDTLTAWAYRIEDDTEVTVLPEQTPPADGQEEPPAAGEDSGEADPAPVGDGGDTLTAALVENDPAPAEKQEPDIQQITIPNVTWTAEPEYDHNTPGAYIYTPVLSAAYAVDEGVELLIITVTVETAREPEQTAVERVQALIDALPNPESITLDNAENVAAQLATVDEASEALTEEERAALDFTRYEAVLLALAALMDDDPALLATGSTPIKLGDYVQMGVYNGENILWRCVAFEKVTGYDANGNPIIDSTDTVNEYKDGYLPLMLADTAVCNKEFDKEGNNTSGSHGRGNHRNNGSNYWGDSNIRDWLNSSALAGGVTWSCGNAPSYKDEAGFLANFNILETTAMKTVTQKTLLSYGDKDISGVTGSEKFMLGDNNMGNVSISEIETKGNYAKAYSKQFTDTMFLLDAQQVKTVYDNYGDYYKLSGDYWLRLPNGELNMGEHVWAVNTSGGVTNTLGNCGWYGVRPAFFLNTTKANFVSGNGGKTTPYSFHKPLESAGAGTIHEESAPGTQGLASINLGDYIELGGYNGENIKWRCVAFEKATRQADGTVLIDSTSTQTTYQAVGSTNGSVGYLPLMLADTSICQKEFDAVGDVTTGSHGRNDGRKSGGSNYWGDSNLRDWLNSTDASVNWSCGNAPSYASEAGFLSSGNFNSQALKAITRNVKQKSLLSSYDQSEKDSASGTTGHNRNKYITNVVQNYATAMYKYEQDSVFCLDVQQLKNVYDKYGDYYKLSGDYWLRSPAFSYFGGALSVDSNGNEVSISNSNYSRRCVRPAFFLNLSSSSGSADGFIYSQGNGSANSPYTHRAHPGYTEPTAVSGTIYRASNSPLIAAGTVTSEGCKMQYKVAAVAANGAETIKSDWSEKVPRAISSLSEGNYKVYWRVVGGAGYFSKEESAYVFDVSIIKGTPVITAPTAKTGLSYTGSAQALIDAGSAMGGEMQYSLSQNSGYSTNIPKGTDAKEYTVWYKVIGDRNHNNIEPQNIKVTIARVTPTYTAPTAKTGLSYTGSAQALIEAGSATGGTMQYSLSQNEGYSTAIPQGTDAKEYTVWYKAVGSGNYGDTEPQSVKVTIAKITPTLTTPTVSAVTYGAKLSDITLGDGWAWDNGNTVPTVTNSGYTAKYTVSDYSNYDWSGIDGYDSNTHKVTRTIAVTVNKANPNVTAPKAKDLTYTGAAQALVDAGSTSDGTIQYSLSQNEGYSTDIPQGKDANTYTVWYKVIGDGNHTDAAAQSVTVTISRKSITGTISITGTATMGETLTASNSADGETVSYQWYRGDTAISGATGGTYTLVAADVGKDIKVIATGTGNYTGTATSNPTAVGNATPTVSQWPTASEITYGQSLSDSTLTGGQASVAGTFTWANTGTKPAVTDSGKTEYKVTFTPSVAGYSTVTGGKVTLTVNKATLTPSASANDKPYDGTTDATGAINLTGVNGESPTASGTFDFANADAGTDKTVNVTNIMLDDGWGANYQLSSTSVTTTATIAQKSISGATVTLGDSLTYTGEQQEQTVSSVEIDGLTATYTVSGSTGTDAGDYTLTVTGTDNFTGTQTAKFTIAKASNSITNLTCANIVFGEMPNPSATATFGTPAYTYSQEGGTYGAWSTSNDVGKWYVKATATGTDNYNGAEQIISFQVTAQQEATPTASIDYGAETLTGLTANAKYSITPEVGTADTFIANENGAIDIRPGWFGKTLSIVKIARDHDYSDSEAQSLPIPARLAAPNVQGADETLSGESDGQITGTSTAMEYSTDGNSWTDCGGTSITNLTPGTYYVRTKAVTGASPAFASDNATVKIEAGPERTYTLEVTAPTFAAEIYGYAQPAAQPITITSRGNSAATISNVVVSGSDFTIGGSGNSVTAGSSITTRTVQPNAGLDVGTHTGTITVTYNNSATATADVSFTVSAKAEDTPSISINYQNETLTGFDTSASYTINGTAITLNNGTFAAADYMGQTISIVRTARDADYTDSSAQSLQVPARPTAPGAKITVKKSDTSITITNKTDFSDCEFSADGTNWQNSEVLSSLTAGHTYPVSVRTKATGTAFASASQTVNVTTVKADGSTTLKPGESVETGTDPKTTVTNDGEKVTITTGGTTTTVTPPPGGEVNPKGDGTVEVPDGTIVKPGNGGPEITVGPGNGGTVDGDGNVTVGGGGKVTVKGEPDNTTITLPSGGTFKPNPDGTVDVPSGSTVQTGENGPEVTLPQGGKVKEDGTITVPKGGTVQLGKDPVTTVTPPTGGEVKPNQDGTVTVPEGTTVKTGDGPELTVGPGNGGTVGGDGGITVPGGGKVTVKGDPDATITLPSGGTVKPNPDGTIPLPGGTVVTPSGKEPITVPDGGGTYDPSTGEIKQNVYAVAVNGGTGSGSYAVGATVTITATVPSGQRFTGWTVDAGGVTLASANSSTTTFTMPAQDVTVTAKFQNNSDGGGGYVPPTYPPVVEQPKEGGSIAIFPSNPKRGDTVTITPKPDEGYEVDKITVTDQSGKPVAVTAKPDGAYSFIQPSGRVKIEVTYKPTETPWSNPFTDVPDGAWYYDAVRFVSEKGLMGGYGNGAFGPGDNLSRAQLAQILFNKENRPVVNYLLQYGDVSTGAWYTEAVRWATSQGIVSGYGNGKFGPNDNITREQLAVMLWRYAGSPAATHKELHFNDTDEISGYALEALSWAVEQGIVNGKGGGILDPKGKATRAEVAAMLMRYLDK